jgi:hypothetical protein
MAETFCPECGTVFESTGTICPNCAATVGNASYVPQGKKGSAISVMPLAKDSGGRRGFSEIDGSQLDLRDRDYVQQQSAPQQSGPSLPESGLGIEGRAERAPQQMFEPESPAAQHAQAAQVEESADSGGWTRAVVIVLIVIAVAFGGKLVMNLVDDKAEQTAGDDDDGVYDEAIE